MKISPSIQIKATFLTIVFLLNTIVGFACAVGVDMGFNGMHHQDHKIIHPSEHVHEKSHYTQHNHDESAGDHHASKNTKENCCKDEVAKLAKADKLNQPGFDYNLLSSSFFIVPYTIYRVSNSTVFPVNTPNAYFILHCRPPIPDIRIVIQSFQI